LALEQLRHVFSVVRAGRPRGDFIARVQLVMDRCYRELGTPELSADYVREARECLAGASTSPPSSKRTTGVVDSGTHHPPPPSSVRTGEELVAGGPPLPVRRRAKLGHLRPKVSVIIPTHNRCAMLASCLGAFEQQTLAKDSFEVIVVDDGSTDGTEQLCQGLSMSFRLVYLRQKNAGAGAARKLGIEVAEGKYLLLVNDDTRAMPGLLAEHLRAQREHAQDKCAVLGDFGYPRQARKRALTSFFATRPFLFPQAVMKAGWYGEPNYFIACNLSIRREAALSVGSFDPQFRVAEDTELGVRLEQQGYRILYLPQARAWHDHLIFTAADLIKRARAYAPADLLLYRKHPRLLGSGRGPFGRLDAVWSAKTRNLLDQARQQVAEWTQAIARFDNLDFAPLFSLRRGEVTEAELVLRAFDQIVPQVHWFHLFERLVELREEERPSALIPQPPAITAQTSAVTG
jgi:GT2 family glycosyltransferase